MNTFIKLWKTNSRKSGAPMLSSIVSIETAVGRAFQGSAQDDTSRPWFIMLKPEIAESVPDVMFFNPSTNQLLNEADYNALDVAQSPSVSTDDESSGIATD